MPFITLSSEEKRKLLRKKNIKVGPIHYIIFQNQ